MRLIHTSTLELHDFFAKNIPKYAILSHRWDSGEVTIEDLRSGSEVRAKAGFQKIEGCCARARLDAYEYAVSRWSLSEWG